ncbi:calcineurin-like phosphoesterase C-terminal domain-containing protein [Glycocaulis sp.]
MAHRTSLALAFLALVALPASALVEPWIASPQVIEGPSDGYIRGVVFEDLNGDGIHQRGEPGVERVLVSNGLDVVMTDREGAYMLPVREDMDLFVIQPSGWRVPVNDSQIPQFSYTHKPGGTPEALRFGGLPDTGPAPAEVNFPLQRADEGGNFTCAMIGDSQTYSNHEISQFRDSAIADLVAADLSGNDCMLYLGDVVGDDLELLTRIFEVGSAVGVPQWAVVGNHDIDLDATAYANSADTWRRLYGPAYYAFEIGEVTFIALNNIYFPCGGEDAGVPGREFCTESTNPRYNVRVDDTQMAWLENLLAEVPEDRLIVIAHHGPMVSFVDAASPVHQTDNATAIYALLEGREALSLSGHTHTLENHSPGQYFEGWQESVGVGPLPFRHIVAGAASGNWWQGDFNLDGDAQALQRMGAPKGVLMVAFEGAAYREHYVGSRLGEDRGQWVDFNTPAFRAWFDAINTWRNENWRERDSVPPVSINDLADTRLLTRQDLAEGTFVTANVWNGAAETIVEARINGGPPLVLERTQEGAGEEIRIGAMYADPFAVKRQATVGRYAIESRSGEERNRGFEAFRGRSFQGPPQPQTALADRNMHLWMARVPADLPEGVHVLSLTSTDRHGRSYTDEIVFEVRGTRPPARFRTDVWEAGAGQ